MTPWSRFLTGELFARDTGHGYRIRLRDEAWKNGKIVVQERGVVENP